MTRLVLLALLLLPLPALAADNPDISGFAKWERVVRQTWVIAPEKPYSGNLKALLNKTHSKYRRIRYAEDPKNYKMPDFWATPEEMRAKRSGDCEDFAIAAYFDLVKAGVPERELWITVALVRKTNEIHAVLRVGDWVLDRRVKRVLTVAEFEMLYQPIYRINRTGWAALATPGEVAALQLKVERTAPSW